MADRILDGTFAIPPEVDKHIAGILRQMKIPDIDREFPPLRLDFTAAERIEAWRKSRERTAPGPTGVHCGHLMAGTYDAVIADFEATMEHLPFASGHPLAGPGKGQLHARKEKERFGRRQSSDDYVI
jgi:hypothetical protein